MERELNRTITPEEVSSHTIGGTFAGIAFVTVFAGTFVTLFLYNLLAARNRDTATIVFLGLCSLFALFFWAAWVMNGVRIHLAVRKFGNVPLTLEGAEPVIGGRFAASIRLPAEVKAPFVLAELVCTQVTHDVKKHQVPRALWARRPRVGVRGGVAQLSFEIPDGLPHSLPVPESRADIDYGTEYCNWKLRVHAEIPGVDFDYSYPILVQPGTPWSGPARPWSGTARAPDARDAPSGAALMERASQQVLTTVPQPVAEQALSTVAEPAAAPLRLPSFWALIAVNMIPVAGFAFLGWRLHQMIFLYWIETVVVCVFACIYVVLAYDFTDDVAEVNRKRADLDIKPFGGFDSPAKRLLSGILSALALGALCAISGTLLFNALDIRGPVSAVFRGLLKDTGMLVVIAGFMAYHAYVFMVHFNDHMIGRPTLRLLGIMVALLLLAPFAKASGFAAVVLLAPLVAAKVWFERFMLAFEHGEAAKRQARVRDTALAAPIQLTPVGRNTRPLSHYLGAWRLAPGERQTPGWFAAAEFYQEAGRLRLRLADHAGPGDAPDALEAVNVSGGAQGIRFVELRVKSGGTRRILRFSASATDPDGLELSETQYPDGDVTAMQARSFVLRRSPGG